MAADTISQFLLGSDMTVYLVIFDRAAYQISGKLFADIAEYIDDHYVDAHADSLRQFPDVAEGYWGYYQIMEAVNSHNYTKSDGMEDWTRLK